MHETLILKKYILPTVYNITDSLDGDHGPLSPSLRAYHRWHLTLK